MFRAVQFLVRHKIAVIAVAAIGFVVFGRNGEGQAVNPWDTDAAQAAASDANTSVAARAIGVAAGAVKEYAGVDLGKVLPAAVRPQDLSRSTIDNLQSAEDAARRANGN